MNTILCFINQIILKIVINSRFSLTGCLFSIFYRIFFPNGSTFEKTSKYPAYFNGNQRVV